MVFKVQKILNLTFFRNENKADFVLLNYFTFANRKICTGTIETKVLLRTGWFYKTDNAVTCITIKSYHRSTRNVYGLINLYSRLKTDAKK